MYIILISNEGQPVKCLEHLDGFLELEWNSNRIHAAVRHRPCTLQNENNYLRILLDRLFNNDFVLFGLGLVGFSMG